ncbi:MAG: glycosyltransferase [Planctomycetota bacterium]|nr:glycosyltransferase [Planctomycetota bacterium]
MRVGFDVSPLHRPHPRGVVRVVAGLVEALERRGKLEVARLAPEPGAHSAHWRQVELPRAESRLGLAGIHSCLSAFPLRGAGKRVQTIHELPWLHGVVENAGWRHRLWARLGPRRADLVLTATESTARDVRAYSGVDARRVRVVPWGLDSAFSASAEAEDQDVLARRGLRRGAYVLCPGGGRAKKRSDAALHGAIELARCGGPSLAVVVTGPLDPSVVSAGGVSFTGEVSDAELAVLYRHATAVAVLSRSEGFGLPALEACAAGVSVLVTRGSAQAEVTGTAGIPVDPDHADSVAHGLARALASTDRDRESRVARAAEFTWDRSAALVEAAWSELLA